MLLSPQRFTTVTGRCPSVQKKDQSYRRLVARNSFFFFTEQNGFVQKARASFQIWSNFIIFLPQCQIQLSTDRLEVQCSGNFEVSQCNFQFIEFSSLSTLIILFLGTPKWHYMSLILCSLLRPVTQQINDYRVEIMM